MASDYGELPRWSATALVARCARLVLPVFDDAWPDAPADQRDSILLAIECTEKSAAAGIEAEELDDLSFEVTCVSGGLQEYYEGKTDPLLGLEIDDDEEFPKDLNMALLAAQVAQVAAKATEAATADEDDEVWTPHRIAIDGVSWALEVTGNYPVINQAVREEFESIQQTAKEQGWADATPVKWTPEGWKEA